ncbi:NeuD/PglB/VioB family sugar acetyltransferase [Oligoflexus tunisiensis]|uniref:NeuD/PglB/VioB family sugar acetyltransferase n=1 Tax=Oligoflexus tunisiensis TaxID=708132 RepID=UPI00114D1B1E|nr:NeuD/PglB/VioB family sugar acetyltransferase [Oligoflexus tunisiensis]
MRLFVIGHGGHAKVVAEAARLLGYSVTFIIHETQKLPTDGDVIEETFLHKHPQILMEADAGIILGVGSVGYPEIRRKVIEKFHVFRSRFVSVVHPRAYIAPSALLNPGVFVAMGALVGTSARIEPHAIVNSGSIVDHDCHIHQGVHIAPGSTLSGNVSIGEWTHIGIGAKVIQGIQIAASVVVGAGAVVTRPIDVESSTWWGVPAKLQKRL